MQRGKEHVCCEALGRNRSAGLLADSLSGSPAADRFAPTHTLVPKALPLLFFPVPFLSPTLSQIHLCTAVPPSPLTHTRTHAHRQMNYVIFCTSPQLLCFHMGPMAACVLANAYFGVYDDRVNGVTACIHQIFGESIKINRCAGERRWDGMDLTLPSSCPLRLAERWTSGGGPCLPA